MLLNVLLPPFTNVKSQIDRLQKDFLGKSYERTVVSEIAILAILAIVENCYAEKSIFLGLHNSLLMGLGQDQQQHLAAHTGGVSRGRVRGYLYLSIFSIY